MSQLSLNFFFEGFPNKHNYKDIVVPVMAHLVIVAELGVRLNMKGLDKLYLLQLKIMEMKMPRSKRMIFL